MFDRKEKVIKNSADILSNAKRVNENAKAEADKSGNSFLYISSFYLTSGGFFNIKCEDYGEEAFKSYGWIDTLSLSIGSENLKNFTSWRCLLKSRHFFNHLLNNLIRLIYNTNFNYY